MNFQEEKLKDIIEEIKPLLDKHWDEVALNKELRPLDIDYDTYFILNDVGLSRIFTARDEGKLVGYFWFVVAPNLHFKTWKVAQVDWYFVDPECRGTGLGSMLVTEAEKWLKTLGVNSVVTMDRVHRSHKNFFTRLGYTEIEHFYEKLI